MPNSAIWIFVFCAGGIVGYVFGHFAATIHVKRLLRTLEAENATILGTLIQKEETHED